MNTTQIIIVIAAILGSGITGYWIGKWWSESYSVPVIADLIEQVEKWEKHSEELEKEIKDACDGIKILEKVRSSSWKSVTGYAQWLKEHPEEVDYSSVSADILPDKDIRINTGNNQP